MIVRLAAAAAGRLDRGAHPLVGRAAHRLDCRARARAPTSRSSRACRRPPSPSARGDPEAQVVSGRFRVILDGFAVVAPGRRLPTLLRLKFVTKVYPSLALQAVAEPRPARDPGGHILGHDRRRGRRGEDRRRRRRASTSEPVLRPRPACRTRRASRRAGARWTTPKVIVARAYPGPGSGRPRTAADRPQGVVPRHARRGHRGGRGRARTHPAGTTIRAVANLSGVAPKAWIGNYRVFNVPTPGATRRTRRRSWPRSRRPSATAWT